MPPLDGLVTKLSSIHGYGVFTTRSFREGEVICFGDGVLYRETDEWDDEYSLVLPGYEPGPDGEEGPPLYLDLTDQTRWINHSCEPNTEVDTKWNPRTKTAVPFWIALRDIEAGEELFYDYAFSAELAMRCLCGMKKCRGVIVDEDEIDDVPDELQQYVCRPTPSAKKAKVA